jgi:hypothetical protein
MVEHEMQASNRRRRGRSGRALQAASGVRVVANALRVLAALALGGCCLPVALPPLGVGGGAGIGSTPKGQAAVGVGVFEATVRPLAAIGSLRDRSFDFGAGVVEEIAGSVKRYGPSLDVRALPVEGVISPTLRARVGTGIEGRVLWDNANNIGPSGALYVVGELVPWVDGDCSISANRTSGLFGCYYGESAIGLRLQGSYGMFADSPVWTVTLGLEFRIPLLVGIVFF